MDKAELSAAKVSRPHKGVHALVDDDGQWYDQGVRVRIERTRSGQSGYHLVEARS